MKPVHLIIKIAGLPLGFSISSASMLAMIQRRYDGYFYPKSKPVISFSCKFTGNYLSKSQKPEIKRDGSELSILRKDFSGQWTDDSGMVKIYRSIYAFDAFLRIVYATILPEYGGFLLHASGTARGNKAYVFGGRSGAGKTTISSLLPMKILNDEITAVKLAGHDSVKVYGTPFWGEMGTGPVYRRKFDLVNLFALNQYSCDEKLPVSKSAALAKLLQFCCCFEKDPGAMDKILKTGVSIIESVPFYQLNFTRTGKCVALLD